MDKKKEYEIYCHFCAIGKKTISASNLEEAKKIIESDQSITFNEIIKFTEPCKVDVSLSHEINEQIQDQHNDFEYKSWGSE
jgi:hypothetical protein